MKSGTRTWADFQLYCIAVNKAWLIVYEGKTYLVSTPLKTCHEYEHTSNTQESTNEVNLLNNLHLCQSFGIGSGWWEVEDDGHNESDRGPDTTQDTAISPP